jgi:hypothetical protein
MSPACMLYVYICMHVYMHTYIYVYTHMYVCICTCIAVMYSVGGVVRLQERKPTPESVFLRSLKKKGLGGRHPLHTKSSTALSFIDYFHEATHLLTHPTHPSHLITYSSTHAAHATRATHSHQATPLTIYTYTHAYTHAYTHTHTYIYTYISR